MNRSIPHGCTKELIYYTDIKCLECDEERKAEHSELERGGEREHLACLREFMKRHNGHRIEIEDGEYEQEIEG